MRTASTVVVLSIFCLSVAAAAAGPPRYPCFRAETAPVIDGDGRDACWRGAPLATGFSILGDGFTDAKQTAFRLCWDDAALYLLVECEEPDVDRMKLTVRDGGPAWEDDGVEVFVQPRSSGQTYQFLITAAAARTSAAGNADFRQIDAAAGRGEASYTLEIAIPHTLVGEQPSEGDTWRGNVCRNIWTTISGGDKFTSWAPLRRQFLEPENFAAIEFRGEPPADEALAAITRDLSGGYRRYLLEQVRGLVAQAPEYVPSLERARESEKLGGRARQLLYRWYRLERMQDASARYSIQDLRAMVQSAEELLAESYQVKYAHLIDGLFPD